MGKATDNVLSRKIIARDASLATMNPWKRMLLQILIAIVLIFFAIFALAPFYFLVTHSFKSGQDMIRHGISLNPDFSAFTLDMYRLLFDPENSNYFIWYRNSVVYAIVQTVLALAFSSMVGYALARYKFKGRTFVFILVLMVMMLPIEIMLIPLFRQMVSLNLVNTIWGVVLPFVAAPVAVFFFRQYSLGLPEELADAGRIDGLTEFGIFIRIMAPLMKPAFGAMAILISMGSWNSVIWPMVVLRDNEMLTIPVGLSTLITPYGNNFDLLMPGAVLAVVPLVIVFLLNQKAFMSGLTVGSIKG
jgi:arabinosaccharide transport system permease protein